MEKIYNSQVQKLALTFKKPGTVIVRRIFLKAPGSVPSSPSACVTCSSIALTLAPTIFTKACRHNSIFKIHYKSYNIQFTCGWQTEKTADTATLCPQSKMTVLLHQWWTVTLWSRHADADLGSTNNCSPFWLFITNQEILIIFCNEKQKQMCL